MTRPSLAALAQDGYDVAVIGAGIVGASAAEHLSAAGYRVLVVDRRDFASGATARSSRFVPNGLRYLSAGGSMKRLLSQPSQLRTALGMARQAMIARTQMVRRYSPRIRAVQMAYPLYRGDPYSGRQLALAMAVLRMLDPGGEELGYRRLSAGQTRSTPLLKWLRAPESLRGAVVFREFQIDWPERLALDALMRAERLGAVARNYTCVVGIDRQPRGWALQLTDAAGESETMGVAIDAKVVINAAGPWVDLVNRTAAESPTRLVAWTKGAHIVVKLPDECIGWGVAAISSDGRPFSITPWRDVHFIGPTETPYTGDPDDVHVDDEDVQWLLEEASRLLPGAGLSEKRVLSGWAGVRPLTWSEVAQAPERDCRIHDLADEGLPGMLAVTGAPLSTHEQTALRLLEAVQRHVAPTGPVAQRPVLETAGTALTAENVRRWVEEEQALRIADVLLRRSGLGWSGCMGCELAPLAADLMADVLGWDAEQQRREVAAYFDELRSMYRVVTPMCD